MKKADFIVIAVVLVIAGVLVFFLYGINSDSGAYVRVEVDGKVVDTLDLNKDATLDIETDNGGTNTLVIKDGKAKVTEANCPDGICKYCRYSSRVPPHYRESKSSLRSSF